MFGVISRIYHFVRGNANDLPSGAIDYDQLGYPFPETRKASIHDLRAIRNEFADQLEATAAKYNKSFFILSSEAQDCDDPKYRFALHCDSKATELNEFAAYIRSLKARKFERWMDNHGDEFLSKSLTMNTLNGAVA